jgi:IclR family KDG regulon transcriptional repressor
MTPRTITDVNALRHELEGVRANGIAYDDGEFDSELRCVAVPVHNFTGQVIGAICISGPVWRLSIQALQNHARAVQSAARRLSTLFGAPRELHAGR